jgi:hypothetical protein
MEKELQKTILFFMKICVFAYVKAVFMKNRDAFSYLDKCFKLPDLLQFKEI